MAKRTPRSTANDSAAMPAQPTARDSRGASPPEDTIGAYPGIERSENDDAITRAVTRTPPLAPRPIGAAPSEDDIRMRAYHRYLERGGDHGLDFEDWVAAERELRSKK